MKTITQVLIFLWFFGLAHPSRAQKHQRRIYSFQKGKRERVLRLVQSKKFQDIPIYEKTLGRYVLTLDEQRLLLLILEKEKEFIRWSLIQKDIITYDIYKSGDYDDYYDMLASKNYSSNLFWGNEILNKLEIEVLERKSSIIEKIDSCQYKDDEIDYIKFYLEDIDFRKNHESNIDKKVELHRSARKFLSEYPESDFRELVNHLHGTFYELSWPGIDFNVGLGLGQNFGELAKNATRYWGIDMDMKLYLHSTFMGLRGNANLNGAKQNMVVDNMSIGSGDGYFVSYYDMYIGRKFDIINRFSFAPFIGGGISELYFESSSTQNGGSMEKRFATNWNYGFDFNINFKEQLRQQTYTSKYRRTLSDHVGYFRLSVSMHHSGLEKYSPTLNGGALSVNLGVGVHFRFKKKSILFSE